VVINALVSATKLTYVVSGWYFDGWRCPGSIPGAGHLSQYVTSHPGQLSPRG